MQKRYTMISLMLAALLLCYIDRIIVSLAAIEMQVEFGWSDSQKGLVLSTFFLGYVLTQLAGGFLSNRFGGRNVLLIAVLLWSLCTVLTPVAAYMSFGMLIVARFMLGIGEGASFPSAYNLIHAWMPVRERSRSIGAMSAASAVGTVATLLFAGILIERYGWPSVFYLFGAMGFVWAAFWLLKVPATPNTPDDTEVRPAGEHKPIPWKLLLAHPAVWTVYLASLCAGSISFVMASWLPSYYVDMFDFGVAKAGIYSVLPWITVAFSTMLGGAYADKHIGRGEVRIRVRKRVTVFGLIIVATGALGIVVAADAEVATAMVCCLFFGLGVAVVGYSPTAAELLPDHGDVFYGIAAAAGSVGAVVMVSATGYLLEVTGSYDALFYLLAAMCSLTAIIYLAFGRADALTGDKAYA